MLWVYLIIVVRVVVVLNGLNKKCSTIFGHWILEVRLWGVQSFTGFIEPLTITYSFWEGFLLLLTLFGFPYPLLLFCCAERSFSMLSRGKISCPLEKDQLVCPRE